MDKLWKGLPCGHVRNVVGFHDGPCEQCAEDEESHRLHAVAELEDELNGREGLETRR